MAQLSPEADDLRCSSQRLFEASNSSNQFETPSNCSITNPLAEISSELIKFDNEIENYEEMAKTSTEMLIKNGHEIQKFAHDRKLDALISEKNYVNGKYKNYQRKIERVIDEYDKEYDRVNNTYLPYFDVMNLAEEACKGN